MNADSSHTPPPPPAARESDKDRRLAEALRKNLARRKAAARAAEGEA